MNLRIGSKGKSVTDLQNMLNNKVVPSPRLKADGDFGNKTKLAVIQFQLNNWLVGDGIVGQCTWNCLTGNEKYAVLHHVPLVPQPTATTCWAASTAMLLGHVTPVKLPVSLQNLLNTAGELLNDSQLDNPTHMTAYCNYFNLKLHPSQSYIPDALHDLLKYKPVMCNLLWNSKTYTEGKGSSSHLIVITGIRGNGEAAGTTLRINDPLPVASGHVISLNYAKLVKDIPTFTYQLYQRK